MRQRHEEAGFTLVELLVSVSIMGIIIPILTGALVIGWRTTDDTIARLSDNRNRALTSSLWTRDVQSAQKVNDGSVNPCLATGDTLVARLSWDETQVDGSVMTRVAAWVWTGGSTRLVERRFCDSSAGITSSVTAAHDIAAAPVITCWDAGGTVVSGCGATTVVVDLAVKDPSGTYRATGRRRSA